MVLGLYCWHGVRVQVWSLKGFFLLQTLTDHSANVGVLAMRRDGAVLFSGSGGWLEGWLLHWTEGGWGSVSLWQWWVGGFSIGQFAH